MNPAEESLRQVGGKKPTAALVVDAVSSEPGLQMLRAKLAHLGRVGVMVELSGALSHELNQPLTGILSNARAASALLAQDPPQRREAP